MECKATMKLVDFGTLKALVHVRFGPMTVRGFKVLKVRDEEPWVASPSREVLRDGQTEYYDVILWENEEVKKEFDTWILKAYNEHLMEGAENEGREAR